MGIFLRIQTEKFRIVVYQNVEPETRPAKRKIVVKELGTKMHKVSIYSAYVKYKFSLDNRIVLKWVSIFPSPLNMEIIYSSLVYIMYPYEWRSLTREYLKYFVDQFG